MRPNLLQIQLCDGHVGPAVPDIFFANYVHRVYHHHLRTLSLHCLLFRKKWHEGQSYLQRTQNEEWPQGSHPSSGVHFTQAMACVLNCLWSFNFDKLDAAGICDDRLSCTHWYKIRCLQGIEFMPFIDTGRVHSSHIMLLVPCLQHDHCGTKFHAWLFFDWHHHPVHFFQSRLLHHHLADWSENLASSQVCYAKISKGSPKAEGSTKVQSCLASIKISHEANDANHKWSQWGRRRKLE